MWRKVRRMHNICSRGFYRMDCYSRISCRRNTIHWLEKQGSCEDSFLNNSVNKLYSSTVELGGIVVKSSSDLINYFSETSQEQKD